MVRRWRPVAAALMLGWGGEALSAPPVNDDCATPTPITSIPFSVTLDASEATSEPTDPRRRCNFDEPGTNSVWWSYTAATDVELVIDGLRGGASPTVSVYRGICGALTESACAPDFEDDDFPIPVGVAAGETILIEVTDAQSVTLDVTQPAAGTPIMLGAELQVNQNSDYDQGGYLERAIGVCASGDGNFVVVWQDDDFPDGYQRDIVARRYDALGTPLGSEFQVNAYTTREQREPAVACEADGDFVVVWRGDAPGINNYAVTGRRFNADGTPKGDDFLIGEGATSPVALASDPAGDFLVAWDDYFGDRAIHGRAFDSSGTAVGPAFEVSPGLGPFTGKRNPAVSADPLGHFVIAWQSDDQDGDDFGIFARQFDAAGTPLGDEFQVNVGTTDRQSDPAIAHEADGSFVIVWQSYYYDVLGRRFDSSGAAAGGDFTVTLSESFRAYLPGVASAGPDDFVVTWNAGVDTSTEMFGRRITGSGVPIGERFRINTRSFGGDMYGVIAHTRDDEFVVAWSSWGIDDSTYGDYGVAAQRFRAGPQVPGCTFAPRTDCREPTQLYKGRLSIRNKTNDRGDSVAWKWTKGEATDVGDFGDPTTDAGFAFCLYWAPSYEPLLMSGAVAPAGTCGDRPCWSPKGDTGFRYVSSTGNETGLTKLTLKAGLEGKATVTVKGKGIALDVPPLPFVEAWQLPLTVQLQSPNACWSATYEAPGVLRNEETSFSAKASTGTP